MHFLLFSQFFFPPPASLSPNLVVSQPSVIRSQPLLHQRLRFQNGAFLLSFLKNTFWWGFFFSLPEFVSLCESKKKKKDFLTWEKRNTQIGGGDAPTPIRTEMWKFNLLSSSDVCLVFTPFSVLLRQGYIGHRDDLSLYFSLNNSYLSLCAPLHAEPSSSTSVSFQQPHRCSATEWSWFFFFISAPREFNLNGHFGPIKWVGEHLWTSPSPNGDHCSNEHAPSALYLRLRSSRAYAASAMCAHWPLVPGKQKRICLPSSSLQVACAQCASVSEPVVL